jgi:tetratricopeptide (TPR) repeat protein
MSTCSIVLLVVTTGIAAAVSDTALAAPKGANDAAVTDKARELRNEGNVLYKRGDLPRARAAYLGAWLLKKHWQIALNLGDTEVRLGLYRDAAEHLAYYLRESANAEPPPPPGGKKLYDEARAKVGALEITSDAGGAEIAVDGKVVGVTPLEDPIFVEPGEHTIEARRGEGFVASTITVEKGEARPVAMNLGVKSLPPPEPHEEDPPRRSAIPAYVGAGISAAALGTGIVLTLLSNGASADADAQGAALDRAGAECPSATHGAQCDELLHSLERLDAFGNGAIVAYTAAGLALVGTAAYLVWPRPRGKATGVLVLPAAGREGAGMLMIGSF